MPMYYDLKSGERDMAAEIPRRLCVDIQDRVAAADGLVARLAALLHGPAARVVLTTSFGLEDQVLTHAAVEAMKQTGRTIEFATLDTGRLFPQTHDVWAVTERRYRLRIACLPPDAADLAGLVAAQGIGGYRESVGNRKTCCAVRKIEPLRRALHGADLWITGLRSDQSQARATTPFAAWDADFGVVKVSPLADWSRDEVAQFAQDNRVPVNVLHAHGFLSIGCAPCTRAVAPDEPERAGRWWWEDESRKECGLHSHPMPPALASVALGAA